MAGTLMLVASLVIVGLLVFFLVATILSLRAITAGLDQAIAAVGEIVEKTAPVQPVVEDINANLDAGVDLLEGLLVKKAGLNDAVGLIDGLYPGAAEQGLRNVPNSGQVKPPRIAEVYTRGTLTLARLGREAPIAATSPNGPALRDPAYGSSAAGTLYPDGRPAHAASLPRSPAIGAQSPVQYDPDAEVGGPRRRMPVTAAPEGS